MVHLGRMTIYCRKRRKISMRHRNTCHWPLPTLILLLPIWVHCGGANPDDTNPPNDSDSQTQPLPDAGSDTSADTDSDTTTDTDSNAGTDGNLRPNPLRGPCLSKSEFGAFTLSLSEETAGIEGRVRDGFVGGVSDELTESGDCRLIKKRVAFCDPACDAGDLCEDTGTCVPYPTNRNVGTVALTGGAVDIQLEPLEPSNIYFNTALPYPPFAPNDELTLTAQGGETSPFTLYGTGIPLILTEDTEWTVARDTEIPVSWTPSDVADAIVTVYINIDQHGASPAAIACEAADTGTLTIPTEIVNGLLDNGFSGRPTGLLGRRTVDSTEIDFSCVSFTVESVMDVPVRMTL